MNAYKGRQNLEAEESIDSPAFALMAESVEPVPPPPGLRELLRKRVADWETVRPLADVRSFDGDWMNAGIPGVELRNLYVDSKTGKTTMLVRMAPGVRFPAHLHHDDEQCLVLKGDIRCGEVVYEEGDFVVMGKGTTHPAIHSVNGNLLLIVAGHNEFVYS